MGRIAETLVQQITATRSRAGSRRRRDPPVFDLASVPNASALVSQGLSPLHAAYVAAQHAATEFAEYAAEFPILASFRDAVQDAEETYLPDGPPMSPLTTSYFTTWVLFDLRVGPDGETLGECLLRAADVLEVGPHLVGPLRRLASSRMGVFVHEGFDESSGLVRLQELVTDEHVVCEVPAGRRGQRGELWYVRLCPPLPDVAAHHLAFTTPYVLVRTSLADWTAYLRRSVLASGDADVRARLHGFLKFGRTPDAWHEFVHQAYHGHEYDAVFLAGIPDVPGSLPHAGMRQLS
jgi:hypothetical protein